MATIKREGQNKIGTLGGQIRLDEGSGRMVVFDGTKDIVVVDRTGFLFSDSSTRRIKLGSKPNYPDDVGLYISKPAVDVIDELGG